MCSREFDPDALPQSDGLVPVEGTAAKGVRAANFARQIVVALKHRPDATILVEDGGVTVLRTSKGGPDVTARLIDEKYVLAIGGWHDEFPSCAPMIDYIEAVLDGRLRVRRDDLNGKVWQIVLERRAADGSWFTDSAIEFPRLAFRRDVVTTYLQNQPHIVDTDDV